MTTLHLLAFCMSVLFLAGFSPAAMADLPIPGNPQWTPQVDEVYRQEVGTQIETDEPVWSVAVWNGMAHVGTPRGVFFVEGDRLTSAGGPSTEVKQLRTLGKTLWAVSHKGLWSLSDSGWTQVASGAYVDVQLHLDGLVVASEDHLYRLEDDGDLVALDGNGSRWPIHGVATYSETLYVRHTDRLGFLNDGRYDYEDVQEWGRLPRSSVTRDMLTLGSRLMVATNAGLSVLRGTSWKTIKGTDGLCYEDTTCVARGFDRDYWVGTTRGAIRVVNDTFHFFGHERWIPHDKVNAIACGDNVAYIATDGGLGMVTYEPYTLQKKAAFYKRMLDEYGMKRLGFINTLQRRPDGTYIRFLDDNDGGWACHYLDALCYEYAVTGDAAVRDNAVDVFKTIKWTEEITPIAGFPARSIHAVGEEANKATTGSAGRPAEWNRTADGKWEWKGDTSSDEVIAQYFTVSLFHDLVAEGKAKVAAKEHLERVTDHIIDNGWVLRDLDGKPTVWARWEPEFIYSPQHTDERALNSTQALAIVAVAQHVVGGEKYETAERQLLEWNYPQNTLRTKITFPGYTHFDDRLAFLSYYPLLNYETDPRLRAMYMRSLQRNWEIKRFENQTWFNFVYGALTGNECQNEAAVQHLRDYPLDCRNHRFTNSHRHDLQVPAGHTNYVSDTKAMGPREQGIRRWDRDPLELDGGGGRNILDPSSFLDAYWMGRYYNMIQTPTATEPELLGVEKRNEKRGAAPYKGTPRPHIF
jgi:hypothetical protein